MSLDVADHQDGSVGNGDRVEPVAAHLDARVPAAIASLEPHSTDHGGYRREQAVLQCQCGGTFGGEGVLTLFVRAAALDCHRDGPDEYVDECKVDGARALRLRVVQRERAQQLPARAD